MPSEGSDQHIDRAVALRRYVAQQQSGEPGTAAEPPGEALRAAYRIYEENGLIRWQIEAYVLAGLSNRETAVRTGIAAEVIADYVSIFFDVRSRLTAGGWISRHILGPTPYRGFREHDVRPFWALMAGSNGPDFLEVLIEEYLAAYRPGERAVMSVYFRPSVPISVQFSVAVSVRGMSADAIATVDELRADMCRPENHQGRRQTEIQRRVLEYIQGSKRMLAGKQLGRPKEVKSRRERARARNTPTMSAGRNAIELPILFVPD
jgi:hypothetical protein